MKIQFSATVVLCLMATAGYAGVALGTLPVADVKAPKYAIKSNYEIMYNDSPKKVESFMEMFQQGTFYGRLRSNTFMYNWEKENSTQQDHITSGLGGSLVYKSASLDAFDFTAAFYYTHGFTDISPEDVTYMKGGAEVLNRFDYSNTGSQDLGVLGQAYLRYTGITQSEVSVGRQLVETFYTKSNDTKMIPNTFDAVVFDTNIIRNTQVKVGYLAKEKLRGHSDAHSVLVYGDANSSSSLNPSWDENDDSAMHKGLTYTKLEAAGKADQPLIVADLHNTSIKDLKLDVSMYSVPELISQGMIEANYNIPLGKELSIAPGVRYIKQFDNGAGAIGGAALDGTTTGYNDPASLEGHMLAARLVTSYKNYKLNFGYTDVFDEADLVTPWRGFPTAGYTRSMARYNWVANTKSYRAELTINDNKSGVYKDLMMQFSALHTDADEAKGQYDENYYYAGFIQNLPTMPEFQWRFRLGYQETENPNADTVDTRLEFNYMF